MMASQEEAQDVRLTDSINFEGGGLLPATWPADRLAKVNSYLPVGGSQIVVVHSNLKKDTLKRMAFRVSVIVLELYSTSLTCPTYFPTWQRERNRSRASQNNLPPAVELQDAYKKFVSN